MNKISGKEIKYLVGVILAIVIFITGRVCNVEAEEEFVIKDGLLMEYNGAGGCVEIPNGVYAIGDRVFEKRIDITEVIIPDGVKSIGAYAFSDCDKLVKVELPNTLVGIGDYAFHACKTLKEIKLPNSVTAIGNRAFDACFSLESVDIPDGIYAISPYTFRGCKNLKNVTIPDSVRTLGMCSFEECTSLDVLTIPNSVINFPDSLCFVANGEKITIRSGKGSCAERYANMEGLPFEEDSNQTPLQGVAFASDEDYRIMEQTGELSYYEGNSANAFIPGSVVEIGRAAFGGMPCESIVMADSISYVDRLGASPNLKNVILGKGVTYVYQECFYYCDKLESIVIPPNVCSIEGEIFDDNNRENVVIYGEKNSYAEIYAKQHAIKFSADIPEELVNLIEESKFDITSYGTLSCYDGNSEDVTIPEGVYSIGASAFAGNTDVKYIEVPDSVTTIDSSAFAGCTNLEAIVIPESVSMLFDTAFDGCPNLTVYGESGSEAQRIAEAKGVTFKTGIPEEMKKDIINADEKSNEREQIESKNEKEEKKVNIAVSFLIVIVLLVMIVFVIIKVVFKDKLRK